MQDDPILDEIHKIREAHAAKFQFDPDAIFDDWLKTQERKKRGKVASAPRKKKPIKPAIASSAQKILRKSARAE